MSLKELIEENDTPSSKFFDFLIQGLILISLVTYSIETLPNLSPFSQSLLHIIETFCIIIFTIEYLVRLWVAEHKLAFVFSFYGLVDLLAILPFFFVSGLDLRTMRIFRLFRLLRAFKLLRYSQALLRLKLALKLIKEELLIFTVATGFVLYVSAVGIYHFEHEAQPELFKSVFHSLWWSIITLTTVGYGDIYPITIGGRIFTFFMLVVGLGVIAVPTGLIASALSETIRNEAVDEED